jgi:hypothetical protein
MLQRVLSCVDKGFLVVLFHPMYVQALHYDYVYCSDEEALNRFENMKDSLRTILSGKYDEVLVNKAYEYFNESYIYLYNMNKYKNNISSVRLEAGKLLNKIANAMGFVNREYYKNGNGSVLGDSLKLERLPKDYKALVDDILFSTSSEEGYGGHGVLRECYLYEVNNNK